MEEFINANHLGTISQDLPSKLIAEGDRIAWVTICFRLGSSKLQFVQSSIGDGYVKNVTGFLDIFKSGHYLQRMCHITPSYHRQHCIFSLNTSVEPKVDGNWEQDTKREGKEETFVSFVQLFEELEKARHILSEATSRANTSNWIRETKIAECFAVNWLDGVELVGTGQTRTPFQDSEKVLLETAWKNGGEPAPALFRDSKVERRRGKLRNYADWNDKYDYDVNGDAWDAGDGIGNFLKQLLPRPHGRGLGWGEEYQFAHKRIQDLRRNR